MDVPALRYAKIIYHALMAAFYCAAIGLVWWGSNWKVALGVFLLAWAVNCETLRERMG